MRETSRDDIRRDRRESSNFRDCASILVALFFLAEIGKQLQFMYNEFVNFLQFFFNGEVPVEVLTSSGFYTQLRS